MGTLYVVATPIGNLRDLSQRAVETLRAVPVVAAEDTRVTRKLLAHIGASPRLVSYHEDSPPSRLAELLALLDQGDVALVTDAGTPGISDPGAGLVCAAVRGEHKVLPVPGPSAMTALLSASGLPAGRALLLGFLPRGKKERLETLRASATEPGVVVLFEAPHRVRGAFEDISEAFGSRRLAVGRELTKLHEEIFHGTARQAMDHFSQPRGEFVIAIEGAPAGAHGPSDSEVLTALARLRQAGLDGRSLVERAAEETGAPRSRVYRIHLRGSSGR